MCPDRRRRELSTVSCETDSSGVSGFVVTRESDPLPIAKPEETWHAPPGKETRAWELSCTRWR
jgi:hypothetical protein